MSILRFALFFRKERFYEKICHLLIARLHIYSRLKRTISTAMIVTMVSSRLLDCILQI